MIHDALRKIRKKVDRSYVPGTIAVYAALCEIAELRRDNILEVSQSDIAANCLMDRTSVIPHLKNLVAARIIKDEKIGPGVHRYTLLVYPTALSG